MGPMKEAWQHTAEGALTAEEAATVFALPPYPSAVRLYTEAPDDAFAAIDLPVPEDAAACRLLADLFRAPAHTAQEVVCRYDAACAQAADDFARFSHMVRRLREGVLLEPETADVYRRALAGGFDEAVAAFARRGWTQGLGWLADEGVLDAVRIDRAIEIASKERGLAAVAFLVQLARDRFGGRGRDFSL